MKFSLSNAIGALVLVAALGVAGLFTANESGAQIGGFPTKLFSDFEVNGDTTLNGELDVSGVSNVGIVQSSATISAVQTITGASLHGGFVGIDGTTLDGNSGSLTWAGNTVWTQGNDGDNSQLDAGKLSGRKWYAAQITEACTLASNENFPATWSIQDQGDGQCYIMGPSTSAVATITVVEPPIVPAPDGQVSCYFHTTTATYIGYTCTDNLGLYDTSVFVIVSVP